MADDEDLAEAPTLLVSDDDPSTSWSAVRAARECPFKWHILYDLEYEVPASKAMQLGSQWHQVLELHYNEIAHQRALSLEADPDYLRHIVVRTLLSVPHTGEWIEPNGELLWWMYDGYLNYFGTDPDWRILATEKRFDIPLYPPEGIEGPIYRLTFVIDMVIRTGGGIWLVENKSQAQMPSYQQLDMDDQMGLYLWGVRMMGKDARGVIHNHAYSRQTQKPKPLDDRFRRTLIIRPDEELNRLADGVWLTTDRVRRPPNGVHERVPDRHCNWCGFKGPCLASRKEGTIEETLVRFDMAKRSRG